MLRAALPTLLLLAIGCAPELAERRGPTDETPVHCDRVDSDGDGIADAVETDADADSDGAPNLADTDSDADLWTDAEEARSNDPCAPADTDGDGTPDFIDTDSDDDGIPDREERDLGTDPTQVDSDGDGFSDLVERAAGTDPTDPTSRVPERDFVVVLPYGDPPTQRTLRFDTAIEQADVFLLVDNTGSMREERANLIAGLLDVIVPGLEEAIDDVQLGVGGVDDYPLYFRYGDEPDRPFYLLHDVAPSTLDAGEWIVEATETLDDPVACVVDGPTGGIGTIGGAPNGTPDLLDAIEGLPCHKGWDEPEAYVPALWATATGGGLEWATGSIPPRECPSIPDEPGARRGYPCFRPESLPIVLLVGDAPFHNGPGDDHIYDPRIPAPTYDEAREALRDLGARVIGVFSGDEAVDRAHWERVATDTGAVRPDGTPLVFDIAGDGTGLSTAVVDAVSELVGDTPQDVHAEARDVPPNPDDVDASRFAKSIVPVEGWRDGISGANPGVSYTERDDTTFYGVVPGTLVDFLITFENDFREPAETAEIFIAEIRVMGNRTTTLDTRNVYVIVPPEGAVILF